MTTRTNVSVAASWTPIVLESNTGIKVQNKGPFLVEVVKASAAPSDAQSNIGEVLPINASLSALADTAAGEAWYARILTLAPHNNNRAVVLVEKA